MVRKLLVVPAVLAVLHTMPAAADPAVEAAAGALATIALDADKLQKYCTLVAQMNKAGKDTPESDALDDQFDALLRSFGPQFDSVVRLSHEHDDGSPEGVALNKAFEAVEKQCKP